MNGFLASRTKLSDGIASFQNEISDPVRKFCALDIRRWLALEAFIPGTHNSTGLAKQYDEHLTDKRFLKDIPDKPIHIFCATDLAYGVNWMFKKQQSGDYQAGFQATPPDWSVGIAIAASSCFPPVFKTLHLNLDPTKLKDGKAPPSPQRDKIIREITFSDGGVYDNLGLEPIWKDHEIVLSSDGGGLFPIGGDTGFAWEIGRYIAIPEDQALAVRKRWLISNFVSNNLKGTYWGIGSSRASYGLEGGYSEDLIQNFIATIRTDLDSFSDAEASVLENHGYWMADAAIQTHVRELVPEPVPLLNVPYPNWTNEDAVKEALKDSSKRTLLGHSHTG